MEYWSIEKKDINPLAITPTLQYSNTPKLIEIKSPQKWIAFYWVIDPLFFRRLAPNGQSQCARGQEKASFHPE